MKFNCVSVSFYAVGFHSNITATNENGHWTIRFNNKPVHQIESISLPDLLRAFELSPKDVELLLQ